MRQITASVLLTTIFLLILFLFLSFLNIYLFVRNHQNRQFLFVHLFSIFSEVILFSFFMKLPVLPENIRARSSHYSIILYIFMLSLLLYGVSLLARNKQFSFSKYKLPPKLNDIFETMDDSVIIADHDGILIDINHAAKAFILQHLTSSEEAKKALIPSTPTTLSELFSLMIPHLSPKDKLIFIQAQEGILSNSQTEFSILGISYFMFLSNIYANKGHSTSIGTNIIFHNIQEETLLRATLTNQNNALTLANETLRTKLKISNSLAEEKERLQLIKEIQYSIIQHIEKVIQEISTFQMSSELKQPSSYQSFFIQLSADLRTIFKNVRDSIQKLSDKSP